MAKVEFHPGDLFPTVGFIVTNRSLPNERVLTFYNGRGTAEQHIKEGKYALKWTRLSCMRFAGNAVRLQLHALAYNLANFLRATATPEPIERWSLTSLRERLIKTGARLVRHGATLSSRWRRSHRARCLRRHPERDQHPARATTRSNVRMTGTKAKSTISSTGDGETVFGAWPNHDSGRQDDRIGGVMHQLGNNQSEPKSKTIW